MIRLGSKSLKNLLDIMAVWVMSIYLITCLCGLGAFFYFTVEYRDYHEHMEYSMPGCNIMLIALISASVFGLGRIIGAASGVDSVPYWVDYPECIYFKVKLYFIKRKALKLYKQRITHENITPKIKWDNVGIGSVSRCYSYSTRAYRRS